MGVIKLAFNTQNRVEYDTVAGLEIKFMTELEKQKQRKPRNRNAIMRIKTALNYLEVIPKVNRLGVRKTRNGSRNVGDLVESVIKSVLSGKSTIEYSSPFKKDLEKVHHDEIKALTCYNSYPNGWHSVDEIKGVLVALPDKRVYYLKKSIIRDNADKLKKSKRNGYQLTLTLTKKLIDAYNLKPHYITTALHKGE